MRVIIKEPGHRARFDTIENTLEALQTAVGGYIETVNALTDCVLIVNEEGWLKGLPANNILGCPFRGTVLLAGVDGVEFADVPIDAMRIVRMTEVTA